MADTTWSAPQNLAHAGVGTAAAVDVLNVAVATNLNGDAVIAWAQRYWSSTTCDAIVGSEVWVRRYTAGTWQSPERVSVALGGIANVFARSATVAIDGAGRITVAWMQDTLDDMEPTSPYARRYEGGGWQPPHRLNAGDRMADEITLGQAGNGDVVFAWSQNTNPYDAGQPGGGARQNAIWSARYIAAGGTWTVPARVGSALIGFDFEERPRLAVGSSGHAVLVWERHGGADDSIFGTRFDPPTSSWSTAIEIDGQVGRMAWPTVAVNASGDAQVAWSLLNAVRDGYTLRWKHGASPQAPMSFETGVYEAGSPRVGIDGEGRAILAWVQSNNTFWDLVGRRVLDGSMENEVVLQQGSGSADISVAVNARGQAIVAQPRNWPDLSVPRFGVAVGAALYLP